MTLPIPLRIRPDAELFGAAPPAALRGVVPPPGLRAVLEPAGAYDYGEALAAMERNARGVVRPPIGPWFSRETAVCRIGEAWHLPRFGALVLPDGSTPEATVGGPPTNPGDLAAAPGLTREDDGRGGGWSFSPPADAPEMAAASVFLPWGGGFNYGHFLIDGLASLLALEEAGLLADLPPIAPPLKRWQRELLTLAFGPDLAVREVRAPVVRLRGAAYATSMDHYLHAPHALLLRLRERVLSRVGPSPFPAGRIYLSRRSHGFPMRVMLNEAELERALERRGFTIVRPERLRPAEQIALCRDARVVIGPTGAGMANALFAAPGAAVVDIQPQVFASAWLPAIADLVGQRWRVYYAPAPVPELEVPWVRRARRGFRFGYRVPIDDVLATLDAEGL